MTRRDEHTRDWSGSNYHRPYRRTTRRKEWAARIAFGIIGGLLLAAFLTACLYAPEIRAALAWH